MAKVWRNSEGREFPLWSEAIHCLGANVNGERVAFRTMRAFGYELVEKEEPEEDSVVYADRVGACRISKEAFIRRHKAYTGHDPTVGSGAYPRVILRAVECRDPHLCVGWRMELDRVEYAAPSVSETDEFEATAQLVLLYASVTEDAAIVDERLDPGELYSVRKVKR